MEVVKINTCPVCSGSRFKKVMVCVDRQATGETFTICRCTGCGLLITKNAPVESQIGRYYDSPAYIPHSDSSKGLMNRAYHLVRRIMLFRKLRLIRHACHIKRGTLLDIGTGTGYFPAYMLHKGWTVTAIEKSEQARRFAGRHFSVEVLPTEELFRQREEEYDAITMWHVTEHIEQLNETWEQIYKSLKRTGVLIVAVPNPRSYDAGVYGKDWAAYDVPRHLWHFTPSVMQQLGAKHGFILAERHTMPFDAFYISMMSERQQKHSLALLRGFWTGLRGLAASSVKKDKSSSITYVFRKK